MNVYQECWWRQAQSDLDVLTLLRRHSEPPSHQLHYLQMMSEKIAKAYFWGHGKPPRKTHAGFAKFIRLLGHARQPVDRDRIASALGFARFADFEWWSRTSLDLVYSLERLAPALAQDGPNPEYPWPSDAPVNVPATFNFPLWQDLSETGRGRRLIEIIGRTVINFPSFC